MKIAAGIVLALFLVLCIGALVLPGRVHVERSRTVAAKPEQLYPLLANLREGWPKWSPFGKAHDAQLQETFSGPQTGVGATESWTGGSMPPGRLVLTRADPASGVEFRIEMENGVQIAGRIALQPESTATRVTWADDVDLGRGILAGWLGLMLRATLGPSQEKALQQLERAAR